MLKYTCPRLLIRINPFDRTSARLHMMSSFPFDRKAMEQERLARQAKRMTDRERSISPPSRRRTPQVQESVTTFSSGAKLNFIFAPADQTTAPTESAKVKEEPKTEQQPSDPLLKYPTGVIKKTWAFGHERSDDVKIEEVLEPRTLRTALLSAFQWDVDWVLTKLNTPLKGGKTKCILVMEAKDDALRAQMLQQTEAHRSYLHLCFPPMTGAFCMHSKLMLLFHSSKLRVAIPSANLRDFDWGEDGVMENSVFMIDLPRIPDKGKQNPEELTPFGKELLFYMEKQGIEEPVRDGILNFDFSATTNIALVHSVGGTSYGPDAKRTGLAGLSAAIRSLNLTTTKDLEIDFAASSIGSLKTEYLRDLHAAARGDDMIAKATGASSKARANFFKPASELPSHGGHVDIKKQIRIYYPTNETVRASKAGAVGSICLQRKWFEAATFPREVFRDYLSTRKGLLSHNKILLARGKQPQSDDSNAAPVAWVYMGSANMSMSAWGTVAKDPKGKISCRNWECGVVLPVKLGHQSGVQTSRIKVEGSNADSIKVEDSAQTKIKLEDVDSGSETDEGPPETTQNTHISLAKHDAQEDGSETENDMDDAGRSVASRQQGKGKQPQRENAEQVSQTASIPEVGVFDGTIEIPFAIPGPRYQGRDPWYFQEYQ